MSVQDVSMFVTVASYTGNRAVSGLKIGDKIVSVRIIRDDNLDAGTDVTSYFSSSVTVDGEINQTTAFTSVSTGLQIVIARGV